jgi:hypothetical protein
MTHNQFVQELHYTTQQAPLESFCAHSSQAGRMEALEPEIQRSSDGWTICRVSL